MGYWDNYKVDVPEGTRGDFRVERFEITTEASRMHDLQSLMGFGSYRPVPPGTYTRLVRGHTIWMSDTPAEIRDHIGFIRDAHGDVLITGLGIGLVVKACLAKSEVTSVTVIEIEPDVIDLVGPHYACDRLEIICADAYTWKPPKGQRWTCAWHDIWSTICADNLPLMGKLHRKFARRVEWQNSWCRAQVKSLRRAEQRDARLF